MANSEFGCQAFAVTIFELEAVPVLHLMPYSADGQIAATDDEIDRLVYELYGLTEDEIRIVEGRG